MSPRKRFPFLVPFSLPWGFIGGDRRMDWLEGSLGDWIGRSFWMIGEKGEGGIGGWVSGGNGRTAGWVDRHISIV
jgi:hypothetical protein